MSTAFHFGPGDEPVHAVHYRLGEPAVVSQSRRRKSKEMRTDRDGVGASASYRSGRNLRPGIELVMLLLVMGTRPARPCRSPFAEELDRVSGHVEHRAVRPAFSRRGLRRCRSSPSPGRHVCHVEQKASGQIRPAAFRPMATRRSDRSSSSAMPARPRMWISRCTGKHHLGLLRDSLQHRVRLHPGDERQDVRLHDPQLGRGLLVDGEHILDRPAEGC
jgi:hypothetical protein